MTEPNVTLLPSRHYTQYAFAGDSAFKHLVFTESDSDLVITYGCFSDLPELETIEFQCGVELIAYDCFCRCPKLRSVKFSQPISKITCAFNKNRELEEVIWPERPAVEVVEQNVGGWRQSKPRPLIGAIDGFNSCPSLSFDQAPLEIAESIGGFCPKSYDMDALIFATDGQKPTASFAQPYVIKLGSRDEAIADTLAFNEFLAGGATITASQLVNQLSKF